MEDWIDITTASFDGLIRPEELALIPQETLTDELVKMADEIRSMITSHSPNTVSADPLKIPKGFLGRAMIIVRSRLLTGIPDFIQDEDRRKQTEKAEAWFMEVARGKIRPQPATDAIPNEVPHAKVSPSPKIRARTRRFSRDQQNGI